MKNPTPQELIEAHSDFLFHFALSKTQDRELSLEMVQETLLTALKKQGQFEGRSQLRTWLTSILNRKLIDHWRKVQRVNKTMVHLPEEAQENLSTGEKSPHQLVENDELKWQLENCIDALPDKWKSVFNARFIEDKTGEEICDEFDIKPSNYWVIVHRAKAQLQTCLEKWL